MKNIESEFEDFFRYCNNQCFTVEQLDTICQPLIWQKRKNYAKRCATIIFIIFLFAMLWYKCDCFAWTISALARLLLIQILPYWNWTSYYNAKCLIEHAPETISSIRQLPTLARDETETENCVLCETIEHIPTLSNVSYAMLETNYLERGLPVIVTNAIQSQNLTLLLDNIQIAKDFLHSEPCDVYTNLLLRKFFHLETVLQKLRQLSVTQERWFLQMRNCRFSAVKSSRLFMQRPYFYPQHLEPYYSSWLLMSNNYVRPQKDVYVKGLILVQQLSGHFDIRLQPKQPCFTLCPAINIQLNAGESLIFSTDLWSMSYGVRQLTNNAHTSLANVLEIDWRF